LATIYTELYQRECENRFGVTREKVREAIASPDSEQRLTSQGLTLILYSKKTGPDRHIVVITHVQGQDLMVDLAFPILPELAGEAEGGSGGVAGAGAALPLHLVQALALKFGLPVRVGERETKFIYNEVIPVSSMDPKKAIRIASPDNRPLVSCIWVRMLQNSMGFLAQCALVFCLDSQAYAGWLAGNNDGDVRSGTI
jgi:hypothetical protein